MQKIHKSNISRYGLIYSLSAVALLFVALAIAAPPDSESGKAEKVWEYRNLGKAFYENPDTHQQAVEQLKRALDLDASSVRERINYGLALLRAGQTDAGVQQLQEAQKQDASLPYTWFNLGIAYKHAGDYERAQQQFEGMIHLVPTEPIGHYNLGAVLRSKGDGEGAMKEFQEASRLNPDLAGPHFQIFTLYQRARESEKATAERKLFEEAKRKKEGAAVGEDMEWCYWAELYDPPDPRPVQQEKQFTYKSRKLDGSDTHAIAAQVKNDGSVEYVTWADSHLAVSGKSISGLTGIRDVIAAGIQPGGAAADLFAVTADGLYEIAAGGPKRVATGTGFTKALAVDFDHDNDLDILLFGPEPTVLRNNGDGHLEAHAELFPFVKGVVTAAAVTAVRDDTAARDIAVAYQDRPGTLYRDDLNGRFSVMDLKGVEGGVQALAVQDVDHDGLLDLVSYGANAAVVRNDKGMYVPAPQLKAPPREVRADFDGDGREDYIAIDSGALTLFTNTTADQHWLPIRIVGVKNPKLATNATIELKAGSYYEKRVYQGFPLSFALGKRTAVDTVRITWPNGLIQNEANRKAPAGTEMAKLDSVEEAQRLSGSCPMIFTWNGERWQFITDVLGVAPLGASAGDGQYFPVDHDEYIQIPGEALHAENGRYRINITEELHEVSYLDKVQLLAVDHPADTRLFTNDKFKAPPYPEFRMFGGHEVLHPLRATDGEGRDVTKQVAAVDAVYATGFQHDVAGVAKPHALYLDFGKNAARSNRAVLILHGWVDWADGSTFLGASQSGRGLQFPALQVRDMNGNWRTIVDDMGIPSGKPKTIAVDLTGKFLSNSREVRILTNLCVYWDEIGLLEDSSAPRMRMTEARAVDAHLHFRGFSRVVLDSKREQPERFIYDDVRAVSNWNPTGGNYTRYGDVLELTRAVDEKLLVMGSGDEVRLEFEAAKLPELPSGWSRDFILLVDGWAKDADANTAFSQSVLPLPFHGMSAYPYRADEHYPDDADHRQYQKEYLTRPALQLIRPLASDLHSSFAGR